MQIKRIQQEDSKDERDKRLKENRMEVGSCMQS